MLLGSVYIAGKLEAEVRLTPLVERSSRKHIVVVVRGEPLVIVTCGRQRQAHVAVRQRGPRDGALVLDVGRQQSTAPVEVARRAFVHVLERKMRVGRC